MPGARTLSASAARMSRPESQTPVRCSLRWVTTSVKTSNWARTSLNSIRMSTNRYCCSAAGRSRPGPASQSRYRPTLSRRRCRPSWRKRSIARSAGKGSAAASTIVSCATNGAIWSSRVSRPRASPSSRRAADGLPVPVPFIAVIGQAPSRTMRCPWRTHRPVATGPAVSWSASGVACPSPGSGGPAAGPGSSGGVHPGPA